MKELRNGQKNTLKNIINWAWKSSKTSSSFLLTKINILIGAIGLSHPNTKNKEIRKKNIKNNSKPYNFLFYNCSSPSYKNIDSMNHSWLTLLEWSLSLKL